MPTSACKSGTKYNTKVTLKYVYWITKKLLILRQVRIIFFPQLSSKYTGFGEELGHIGESPMTQILSPIRFLIPQIWGITPETVTLFAAAFKNKQVDEVS